MRRRLLFLFGVIGLLTLVSCTSTVEFWAENMRNRFPSWKRDLNELHRSIDYHIFNYDWDDPYI